MSPEHNALRFAHLQDVIADFYSEASMQELQRLQVCYTQPGLLEHWESLQISVAQ